MNFTELEVYNACKQIAPQFKFDHKLIYAVCLQESDRDKSGLFKPDVARLEQGYYRKYVEPKELLATTSEILLSASYGIMQMMGLSLKEAGYFDWYFTSQASQGLREIIKYPLSQFAIPSALDYYCVNLDWMIFFGCKWMDKKRILAKGDERKMLELWNGSSAYPDKVYQKLKLVK